MAYGLPDPGEVSVGGWAKYYDGFADTIAEFVSDKRATGWFADKDDMLSYYRFKWDERQLFVADVAWDIAELGDAA